MTVADLVTLTDLAFGLGLLTAIFGFYARFIRPSVVSTVTWRTDMEGQVRELRTNMEARVREVEQRVEHHGKTDQELLSAVKSQGKDLVEIKTQLAVLEERSQRWVK